MYVWSVSSCIRYLLVRYPYGLECVKNNYEANKSQIMHVYWLSGQAARNWVSARPPARARYSLLLPLLLPLHHYRMRRPQTLNCVP